MFHITCNLPYASKLINGIKFVAHEAIEGAVRTEEAVTAEVAALFKGIKGYTIEDAEKKPSKPAAIVFPPTDEQVDTMKPAAMAAMLKDQKADMTGITTPPQLAAALKELAAKARASAEPATKTLV